MPHARDANELLEIAGNELRPIVRDDSRFRLQVFFLGSLQDHFDVSLPHRLAQLPMQEEATEPIQNATQVVERATKVDVVDIDMPVLVRLQGLRETNPPPAQVLLIAWPCQGATMNE